MTALEISSHPAVTTSSACAIRATSNGEAGSAHLIGSRRPICAPEHMTRARG